MQCSKLGSETDCNKKSLPTQVGYATEHPLEIAGRAVGSPFEDLYKPNLEPWLKCLDLLKHVDWLCLYGWHRSTTRSSDHLCGACPSRWETTKIHLKTHKVVHWPVSSCIKSVSNLCPCLECSKHLKTLHRDIFALQWMRDQQWVITGPCILTTGHVDHVAKLWNWARPMSFPAESKASILLDGFDGVFARYLNPSAVVRGRVCRIANNLAQSSLRLNVVHWHHRYSLRQRRLFSIRSDMIVFCWRRLWTICAQTEHI